MTLTYTSKASILGILAVGAPPPGESVVTGPMQHPTIQRVSLAIPAGCKLAVVGRSGAGKSTLASCLCAMYEHTGQVRVGGNDVRLLGRVGIQRVCTAVVQGDAVTSGLSLMENILGPSLLAEGCARAATLELRKREAAANSLGPARAVRPLNVRPHWSLHESINAERMKRGLGAMPQEEQVDRIGPASAPLLQLALAALEAVGFFEALGEPDASDRAKQYILGLPVDSQMRLTAVFEKRMKPSSE